MSLPPDDENFQPGPPQIDEPPVDPHDTRPLKPLLAHAAPSAGTEGDDPPAATVLREGRGTGTLRQPPGGGGPGIDDSTDRLRLIPRLPNPPTWRAIFMVGQPQATTVGVDVRQALVIGRGDNESDAIIGLDLSAHHAAQQGVSRQHAVLVPTPEGLLLSDLGSTNGTWINGQYLEPGYRHEIGAGDQIELGLLRLVVRSVTLISRAAG